MSRIVFANRFYVPDHSATSQILSDLAVHLAHEGHEVHVVCAAETLDGRRSLRAEEVIDGVHIHRVRSTNFGRANIARRAADSVVLYFTMFRTVLDILRPGDILVAKTDPPLLSIPMARAAAQRGATLINWLQDLYPEVAAELGVSLGAGIPGRILAALRDRSLQVAKVNVAIGDRMRQRLLARGLTGKIDVIPNWADDGAISPVRVEDNPLRDSWNLRDRFVVGYSGNLGRAHEVETLIGAAALLRNRKDIVFLFVGGGHQVASLQAELARRDLGGQFQFRPYQERSRLSLSLGVADVHWISLRPNLEGLIVPSKFYGIAAAGRPIICVTAPDGEIAGLVTRFECGRVVTPGDSAGLAQAVTQMADERRSTQIMGARARAMLKAHFSKAESLARWSRRITCDSI